MMGWSENENREHARQRIAAAGRIVLPDDQVVVCTVHDISDTGAMLFLDTEIKAPAEFRLSIEGSPTATRHCAKVWQEGTTLAVSFPDRQPEHQTG